MPLNNHQRRYVARLRKRMEFLAQRVTIRAAQGNDYSYDAAEAKALKFALLCIDLCERLDLLTEPKEDFRD